MATPPPASDPAPAGLHAAAEKSSTLRYADIGINLTDPVYQGVHHGKQVHDADLDKVIERATQYGCEKLMITGSDLAESEKAIRIAKDYPGLCYATVGVHPCSALAFTTHPSGPDSLLSSLRALALSNPDTVTAFGEIGLDYDRLQHCPASTQRTYFRAQLSLAVDLQLPLFLHSRAAAADFEAALRERLDELPRRGVVHSFTGSVDEMRRIVAMGFDVGVNGCSLKTEANLEVVRAVPLERLQLETDGPWCEIRPSHAAAALLEDADAGIALPRAVKKEKWAPDCMVKGRNEPCAIARVAHVVARVKGVPVEVVCEAAWRNSVRMFGLGEARG